MSSVVESSLPGSDASGGFVVAAGDGLDGDLSCCVAAGVGVVRACGPTVVTIVGDFVGERLGRVGGNLTGWRGAGVILAGPETPPRVEDGVTPVSPVVKGSGAILRGGMLEMGDVRLGREVRLLIAGRDFSELPI